MDNNNNDISSSSSSSNKRVQKNYTGTERIWIIYCLVQARVYLGAGFDDLNEEIIKKASALLAALPKAHRVRCLPDDLNTLRKIWSDFRTSGPMNRKKPKITPSSRRKAFRPLRKLEESHEKLSDGHIKKRFQFAKRWYAYCARQPGIS